MHQGSSTASVKVVGACLAYLKNSRKSGVPREVNDGQNRKK